MAERSLELTIISAKDLNNVNLITKMNVYAVVCITGAGKHDQKQKTHVDKDGGSDPTWNYPMKFTIDESAALQNQLTLVVKIKAEGMFGDTDVGVVHVPVKELVDGGYIGRKPLQFVSYQVRKPNGKPKGELSFSYKFGEKLLGGVGNIGYSAVGFGYNLVYPPLNVAQVGGVVGSYPPPASTTGAAHGTYPTAGVGKVEEPVMAYPTGHPDKANRLDEPVTAYPAVGSGYSSVYPPLYATPVGATLESYPPAPTVAASSIYPPAGDAYYPSPVGYPEPHVGYEYHQQPTYSGYPPPPVPGYGVYPPQVGYGYPPVQQPQKKNKFGFGTGLLGGALGGLLIGDIVSDAADGGGCSGGCGGGCGGF